MILAISLNSVALHAQTSELPAIERFKSVGDFRKAEKQVREALNWTTQTSSFANKAKRNQIKQYTKDFFAKSGYLWYAPAKKVAKFRNNSEYGFQFQVGWMRYVLTYEYSKNKLENHYQAMLHVLKFYQEHKATLGRNSYLEKMKKLKANKELKKFIESEL